MHTDSHKWSKWRFFSRIYRVCSMVDRLLRHVCELPYFS